MNDLQIEYFLAAAEAQSFTKAAAEKYVSQPAISKQIATLEDELGVVLFERSARSTSLTVEGQHFADFFRRRRDSLAELVLLSQKSQRKSLTLRLGVATGWYLNRFMPQVLQTLAENQSNLHLSMDSMGFMRLPAGLKENELDMIITVGDSLKGIPLIEVEKLTTIPSTLIFSRKHPLADKPGLKLEDFRRELFILSSPDESGFLPDAVKAFCKPRGFEPRVRIVRNNESMILSVMNKLGVAIAEAYTWEAFDKYLGYIPLDNDISVAAAWRVDDMNPALPIMLNALKTFFAGNDTGNLYR